MRLGTLVLRHYRIQEHLVTIREVIDDTVMRDGSLDRNEISQSRHSDLTGRHSQFHAWKRFDISKAIRNDLNLPKLCPSVPLTSTL